MTLSAFKIERIDMLSHEARPEYLHVAVGVIKNSVGQILISLRKADLHQGGLWEFPGGKIEGAETAEQALIRELKEELDIAAQSIAPLISINHHYPDLAVKLHVFLVESFTGTLKSREGQPVLWVDPDNLADYSFPAANWPIVTAAQLPPFYAILDDAYPEVLRDNLKIILNKKIKLIQARLKNLPPEDIQAFLKLAQPLCLENEAGLLLNSGVVYSGDLSVDGIHLTGSDLMACGRRPDRYRWVGASCHNLEELRHAEEIGADFAVLAPVLPTPTHPNAPTIGWEKFAGLVERVSIPVYALGGMSQADLTIARQAGAQGIAGVRMFLG